MFDLVNPMGGLTPAGHSVPGDTVPFRPGMCHSQKKTDWLKIHHKSKDIFSAFSESKFSEIVNTQSKWYSMLTIQEAYTPHGQS
jgi:hypothetical protein